MLKPSLRSLAADQSAITPVLCAVRISSAQRHRLAESIALQARPIPGWSVRTGVWVIHRWLGTETRERLMSWYDAGCYSTMIDADLEQLDDVVRCMVESASR